jgi:CheY-like chemotaxis protein
LVVILVTTSMSELTPPLAPSGRPWRILVIDDDEAVRSCTRALFARAGFDARSASSAEAGLAAARDLRPDVILMDLRMSEMDGVEALARLRGEPALQSVATAVYSGFIPLFGEGRLRQLGFAELIYKPLNFDELLGTVLRILGSAPRSAAAAG